MDKMPWMPWYGYDYESDEKASMLDEAGHGVYFRLLWHQWKEGSVPATPTLAAAVIRTQDLETVGFVLETFFEPNGDPARKVNRRLEQIRDRHLPAFRAMVEGGRKGGKIAQRRRRQRARQPELPLDLPPPPDEPPIEAEGQPMSTVAEVPAETGGLPARRGRTHLAIREHLAASLAEVAEGVARRVTKIEVRKLMAELVFAYWQTMMGHKGALYDEKREARLRRQLEANGDNVHELLYAIDGWFKDPTFRELDDKGRKLDGIQNIFADRERIERLANHMPQYREGKPHRMAVKYLQPLTEPADGGAVG